MKNYALVMMTIGGISLILGIYSRLTLQPLEIFPGSATAENFLDFTNTCFLVAIAFLLFDKAKK